MLTLSHPICPFYHDTSTNMKGTVPYGTGPHISKVHIYEKDSQPKLLLLKCKKIPPKAKGHKMKLFRHLQITRLKYDHLVISHYPRENGYFKLNSRLLQKQYIQTFVYSRVKMVFCTTTLTVLTVFPLAIIRCFYEPW
jgi:hypothetical protein